MLQSKDEAKFIVRTVLPRVCISANAFMVPSEFYLPSEIQSLARRMFLNLYTVLWLPDIREGGEGCDVLEAVWPWICVS